MKFYCPNCWTEISETDEICPQCGVSVNDYDNEEYIKKLIRALHHPEPETPVRAATILGWLRVREALPELIRTLNTTSDPYIAVACMKAIGEIADSSAIDSLYRMTDDDKPLIVRNAAKEIIAVLSKYKL
jgi:HEAT repeat protein